MTTNPYKANKQQLHRTLKEFRAYLYRGAAGGEGGELAAGSSSSSVFATLPPLLHTLHFGDCPCLFCKGAALHEQLNTLQQRAQRGERAKKEKTINKSSRRRENAAAGGEGDDGGDTDHNDDDDDGGEEGKVFVSAMDAHTEELDRRRGAVRISPTLLQVGPAPQLVPRGSVSGKVDTGDDGNDDGGAVETEGTARVFFSSEDDYDEKDDAGTVFDELTFYRHNRRSEGAVLPLASSSSSHDFHQKRVWSQYVSIALPSPHISTTSSSKGRRQAVAMSNSSSSSNPLSSTAVAAPYGSLALDLLYAFTTQQQQQQEVSKARQQRGGGERVIVEGNEEGYYQNGQYCDGGQQQDVPTFIRLNSPTSPSLVVNPPPPLAAFNIIGANTRNTNEGGLCGIGDSNNNNSSTSASVFINVPAQLATLTQGEILQQLKLHKQLMALFDDLSRVIGEEDVLRQWEAKVAADNGEAPVGGGGNPILSSSSPLTRTATSVFLHNNNNNDYTNNTNTNNNNNTFHASNGGGNKQTVVSSPRQQYNSNVVPRGGEEDAPPTPTSILTPRGGGGGNGGGVGAIKKQVSFHHQHSSHDDYNASNINDHRSYHSAAAEPYDPASMAFGNVRAPAGNGGDNTNNEGGGAFPSSSSVFGIPNAPLKENRASSLRRQASLNTLKTHDLNSTHDAFGSGGGKSVLPLASLPLPASTSDPAAADGGHHHRQHQHVYGTLEYSSPPTMTTTTAPSSSPLLLRLPITTARMAAKVEGVLQILWDMVSLEGQTEDSDGAMEQQGFGEGVQQLKGWWRAVQRAGALEKERKEKQLEEKKKNKRNVLSSHSDEKKQKSSSSSPFRSANPQDEEREKMTRSIRDALLLKAVLPPFPPIPTANSTSSSFSTPSSQLLAAACMDPLEAALHLSYINVKLGAINLLRVLLSEATTPPPRPQQHRRTNCNEDDAIRDGATDQEGDPLRRIAHLEATIMSQIDYLTGSFATAAVKVMVAFEESVLMRYGVSGGGGEEEGDTTTTAEAMLQNLIYVGHSERAQMDAISASIGGGVLLKNSHYLKNKKATVTNGIPTASRRRLKNSRHAHEGEQKSLQQRDSNNLTSSSDSTITTTSDSEDADDTNDGAPSSTADALPSPTYTLRKHFEALLNDVIDIAPPLSSSSSLSSSTAAAAGYQRLFWTLPPTAQHLDDGASTLSSPSPQVMAATTTLSTITAATLHNCTQMLTTALSSPAPMHPLFNNNNKRKRRREGRRTPRPATERGGEDRGNTFDDDGDGDDRRGHADGNTANDDYYDDEDDDAIFGSVVMSVASFRGGNNNNNGPFNSGRSSFNQTPVNSQQQQQQQGVVSASIETAAAATSARHTLPLIEVSTANFFSSLLYTAIDALEEEAALSSLSSSSPPLTLLRIAMASFLSPQKNDKRRQKASSSSSSSSSLSSALSPQLRSAVADCFAQLLSTFTMNAVRELRVEKGTADYSGGGGGDVNNDNDTLTSSLSSPSSASSSTVLLFATPAFATLMSVFGSVFHREQDTALTLAFKASFAAEEKAKRRRDRIRRRKHSLSCDRMRSSNSSSSSSFTDRLEAYVLLNHIPLAKASALQWQSYVWHPILEKVLVPMLLRTTTTPTRGLSNIDNDTRGSGGAVLLSIEALQTRVQVSSLLTNMILLARYAEWAYNSSSSNNNPNRGVTSASSPSSSSSRALLAVTSSRMYQGLVAHLLGATPHVLTVGEVVQRNLLGREENNDASSLSAGLPPFAAVSDVIRRLVQNASPSSPTSAALSFPLSLAVSYADRCTPFSRVIEIISAHQHDSLALSSSSSSVGRNTDPLTILVDSTTSRLLLLLLAVERENPTFLSQLTYILQTLKVEALAEDVRELLTNRVLPLMKMNTTTSSEARSNNKNDDGQREASRCATAVDADEEIKKKKAQQKQKLFVKRLLSQQNKNGKKARGGGEGVDDDFELAHPSSSSSQQSGTAGAAAPGVALSVTTPSLLAVYSRVRRVLTVLSMLSSSTTSTSTPPTPVLPIAALVSSLSRAMSVLFADLLFYQRFPEDVRDDGAEEVSYSITTDSFVVSGTRTDLNNAQVAAYDTILKATHHNASLMMGGATTASSFSSPNKALSTTTAVGGDAIDVGALLFDTGAVSESLLSPKHKYENPLETELEKCKKLFDQRPRLHAVVLQQQQEENDNDNQRNHAGGAALPSSPTRLLVSPTFTAVSIAWAPRTEDYERMDFGGNNNNNGGSSGGGNASTSVIVQYCPPPPSSLSLSSGGGHPNTNSGTATAYASPTSEVIAAIHSASGNLAPNSRRSVRSSSASVGRCSSSNVMMVAAGGGGPSVLVGNDKMPKPSSYGRSLTPSTLNLKQRQAAQAQREHKDRAGTYSAHAPNPIPFFNPTATPSVGYASGGGIGNSNHTHTASSSSNANITKTQERIRQEKAAEQLRMLPPTAVVGTQRDLSSMLRERKGMGGGGDAEMRGQAANATTAGGMVGLGTMVNGQSCFSLFGGLRRRDGGDYDGALSDSSTSSDGSSETDDANEEDKVNTTILSNFMAQASFGGGPPLASKVDTNRDWLLYQFSTTDFVPNADEHSAVAVASSSLSSQHWQIALPLPPTQHFLCGSNARRAAAAAARRRRDARKRRCRGLTSSSSSMPSPYVALADSKGSPFSSPIGTQRRMGMAKGTYSGDDSTATAGGGVRGISPIMSVTAAGRNAAASPPSSATMMMATTPRGDRQHNHYAHNGTHVRKSLAELAEEEGLMPASNEQHHTMATSRSAKNDDGSRMSRKTQGGTPPPILLPSAPRLIDPLLSCEWTVVAVGTVFESPSSRVVASSSSPRSASSYSSHHQSPSAVEGMSQPPTTSIIVMEEQASTAKVRAARLYSFNLVQKEKNRRNEGGKGNGGDGVANLSLLTGRAERGVVAAAFVEQSMRRNNSTAMMMLQQGGGGVMSAAVPQHTFSVISPLNRAPSQARLVAAAGGGSKAGRINMTSAAAANATSSFPLSSSSRPSFVSSSPTRGGGGGGSMVWKSSATLGGNGNGSGGGQDATVAASSSSFLLTRRPTLANIVSFRRGGTKPLSNNTNASLFHTANQFTRSAAFTNRGSFNSNKGIVGGSSSSTMTMMRVKMRAVAFALQLVQSAATQLMVEDGGGANNNSSALAYAKTALLRQQQYVPLNVNNNNGGGGGAFASSSHHVDVNAIFSSASASATAAAATTATAMPQYSQQARGSTNTVRVGAVLAPASLNSAKNGDRTTVAPSKVVMAATSSPVSSSVYSRWLSDHFGSQSEAMAVMMPLYTRFLEQRQQKREKKAEKRNPSLRAGIGGGGSGGWRSRVSQNHNNPSPSAVRSILVGLGARVSPAVDMRRLIGDRADDEDEDGDSSSSDDDNAAGDANNRNLPRPSSAPPPPMFASAAPTTSSSDGSAVATLLRQLESLRSTIGTANDEKEQLQKELSALKAAQTEWLKEKTNHALTITTLQETIVHPLRTDMRALIEENERLTSSLATAHDAIKRLQQDAVAMVKIIKKQSDMMAQLNHEAVKNSPLTSPLRGRGGSPPASVTNSPLNRYLSNRSLNSQQHAADPPSSTSSHVAAANLVPSGNNNDNHRNAASSSSAAVLLPNTPRIQVNGRDFPPHHQHVAASNTANESSSSSSHHYRQPIVLSPDANANSIPQAQNRNIHQNKKIVLDDDDDDDEMFAPLERGGGGGGGRGGVGVPTQTAAGADDDLSPLMASKKKYF